MKIPLTAYAIDDNILIYRNSEINRVKLPIKPFILAQKDQFPDVESPIEIWRKVPEDEPREYFKMEFATIKELHLFKQTHSNKSRYMLSNSYMEQLYISRPDFLLAYPHSNDLTIMFFDIEVASKGEGLFPKPFTNEILCIGYSLWKYKNDGSKEKVVQKICKGFDIDTLSDKKVIDEFFKDIKELNPDIISGYYIDVFDMPFLIERAKIIKSDLKLLGRGGYEPIVDAKTGRTRIPGRILFDIYSSNSGVIKDQTLSGIKSKTLKDLGRWYKVKRTHLVDGRWIEDKLEDIEIKEHLENTLALIKSDPERLYAYNNDDIYRTEGVGHIYLRNCITLAEMMTVPLDNIINMYSSFIPKLFVARSMEKLKLINTETNFNRYNVQNGSIAKLGTKYQGAIVGLYKDGFFPAVWKLDFSSQYPSTIQTWNLGPDTTSLVRVEEYTGRYKCEIQGDYNWYRVPTTFENETYKYDLIVRVKNNIDGFLKKDITRLKEERKKIRTEEKAATGDIKAILNAQQSAIKVIINSLYGIQGLKSSVYGDMISAAVTTGMARWCTLKVMQRNKNDLIEEDTDGSIVTKKIDPAIENEWLSGEIKKQFNLKDNFMSLDLDGDGERAYFYLMKNYVIEKSIGDYTIHGSSLKGSKSAKVVDRAINFGIEHIFNNKSAEDIIAEAYNFNGLTLDDFVERAKMAKNPIEYDDKYDFRLFLAKQVEMKTGQVITAGAQMNFVVTKNQLPYAEFKPYYRGGYYYTFTEYVENINELNTKYYIELIDEALKKFGIDKNAFIQTNMFEQPERRPIKDIPLDIVPIEEI